MQNSSSETVVNINIKQFRKPENFDFEANGNTTLKTKTLVEFSGQLVTVKKRSKFTTIMLIHPFDPNSNEILENFPHDTPKTYSYKIVTILDQTHQLQAP